MKESTQEAREQSRPILQEKSLASQTHWLSLEGRIAHCLQQSCQMLSAVPISVKPHCTIKILKAPKIWIGFGVIDYEYSGHEWTDQDNYSLFPNILYYLDCGIVTGQGRGGLVQLGQGFKQGDTVSMDVDLAGGSITWHVNGTLQATYNFERLKDSNIKWAAYVMMRCQGSIEWCL